MSNDRLPKQVLFGMLAPAQDRIARPAAGRPTKAWSDYVREDLGHLRLAYDWYRQAQNRQVWRDAMTKLLEHT